MKTPYARLASCCAALVAVGFLTAPTKQANASPNKIYVGVGSSNAEYWQDVLWGVGQMAQSVGAKVVVLDSGYEGAKHLQQLDAVLAPGCEHCVFVWFPDSPAFTKVTVDRVERAGAFVTTLWNRPEALHPWAVAPDAWVANIAFDGVDAGYKNAMELCKAIGGHGGIITITGIPDDAPAKQRAMGMQKALKQCPGMTVLGSQIASWSQTPAQVAVRELLARFGGQIKGIFAQNDAMALGAVAALREKGLAGKIPVTGTDGSTDVLQLIKSGEILSTMKEDAFTQGAVATALTYAAASGGLSLDSLAHAQRDFFLDQVLVTKANVDQELEEKPDRKANTFDALKANF
jgi:ribose transport system substrate-binding protein